MESPAKPRGFGGPRRAARIIDLPEPFSYRLKRKLLGPPLVTERLSEERLGNLSALGVLSPDCISSTAYGPEEILTVLVPAIGAAAFALIMPIAVAVVVVLFFVTLSYREVVMAYTKAGGAYVVARENFGVRVAQIAAVALIIDYIVTVAVQTAAGTDAVTSAFPALRPYDVEITIGVVVLLCYGNLRGIREAARTFALPTYLFITATGVVVIAGVVRALLGKLPAHSIHMTGVVSIGSPGNGLLLGASLFVVLRAFANGGSSLTGLEAISNGVATFRRPEGRNARRVLVLMSSVLGTLVLGVSFIAWRTHAVPFVSGSPTVLSQEAAFVLGHSIFGRVGYYLVQGATMLILYTGANTSFNGFPNLVSFVAEDAFLPKRLTRRGHRLVFSNGIMILAFVSIILLIVTRARVDALVAVYAIGVFTGFTMAGAGMVRFHFRGRLPGYRRRAAVNGFAAFLSAIVVIIFAVTKFTEGAWTVVILFPVLVAILIRLNRTYTEEAVALEVNVQQAAKAPVLRRHVVLVFVEHFDLAAVRALQYARSLATDQPTAVHFMLDEAVARRLEDQWIHLGLSRIPLEIMECPDRRIGRAAIELVAEHVSDNETEVTVLLPRRIFESPMRRILHDRTSERIAALVSEIPNASATILPFPLGKRRRYRLNEHLEEAGLLDEQADPGTIGASTKEVEREEDEALERAETKEATPGVTPIGSLTWRQHAKAAGRVRSVRVQPGAGVSVLECTLVDATGQLIVVFQGRRLVPGIDPGARLLVEGIVGERGRRLAMINPVYTILTARSSDESQ